MTDQKQCAKLKNIKCFLFDMDGTINLGNTLIPGMDVFFQKLRAAERDFYLVTNNSSKGHEHYVEKMGRMGIQVTRDNVLIFCLLYAAASAGGQIICFRDGTAEENYS